MMCTLLSSNSPTVCVALASIATVIHELMIWVPHKVDQIYLGWIPYEMGESRLSTNRTYLLNTVSYGLTISLVNWVPSNQETLLASQTHLPWELISFQFIIDCTHLFHQDLHFASNISSSFLFPPTNPQYQLFHLESKLTWTPNLSWSLSSGVSTN